MKKVWRLSTAENDTDCYFGTNLRRAVWVKQLLFFELSQFFANQTERVQLEYHLKNFNGKAWSLLGSLNNVSSVIKGADKFAKINNAAESCPDFINKVIP